MAKDDLSSSPDWAEAIEFEEDCDEMDEDDFTDKEDTYFD